MEWITKKKNFFIKSKRNRNSKQITKLTKGRPQYHDLTFSVIPPICVRIPSK